MVDEHILVKEDVSEDPVAIPTPPVSTSVPTPEVTVETPVATTTESKPAEEDEDIKDLLAGLDL